MTAHSCIVTEDIQRCIDEQLIDGTLGVMVYGSVARGTAGRDSDVDVLQLRDTPHRPYRRGRVNVSVYTPHFLSRIAKLGSLFVLHLRHEGILVSDHKECLTSCLQSYVPLANYDCFRSDLREAAGLLDVHIRDYEKNWRAYNRVGLFFLRSQLFSEQAETGSPSFSVPDISDRRRDYRLRDVYQIKYSDSPNWKMFCGLRFLVEEYLGCAIANPSNSVEGLMLKYDQNEMLVSLGYRLIGKSMPYDFYTAIREQLASLRAAGRSRFNPQDILSNDK